MQCSELVRVLRRFAVLAFASLRGWQHALRVARLAQLQRLQCFQPGAIGALGEAERSSADAAAKERKEQPELADLRRRPNVHTNHTMQHATHAACIVQHVAVTTCLVGCRASSLWALSQMQRCIAPCARWAVVCCLSQ